MDNQGEVFRYKKTGVNPGTDEYSEIGFYNELTSWELKLPLDDNSENAAKNMTLKAALKAAANATTDTALKAAFETASQATAKIDRINIQSTGDIHAKAQNHYQTQTKRFELLVDCDAVDHATEKQPFGDQDGDDPNLYAGDAHIRAKNRIVIKAGDEIRLQVGRSSIIIADSGITIASRKTKSTIDNPWDTLIGITPMAGINIFGHHVKIKSAVDFSLADSYGGELTSMMGVTRLYSKDLKAQSNSLLAYGTTGLGTIVNYMNIITSMSAGLGKSDDSLGKTLPIAHKIPRLIGYLGPELIAVMHNINCGYLDADGSEGSDPINSLLEVHKIVNLLLQIVGIVLETVIPKKNMKDGRDPLVLAISIADCGLSLLSFYNVYYALVATTAKDTADGAVITTFHTSFLHLTGSAGVVLAGASQKKVSGVSIDAASPFAGLGDSLIKKYLKTSIGFGIVGLVAIGGIVAGAYFASKANQEELDKLKEL